MRAVSVFALRKYLATRGAAMLASSPRINSTTISSSRVKPRFPRSATRRVKCSPIAGRLFSLCPDPGDRFMLERKVVDTQQSDQHGADQARHQQPHSDREQRNEHRE